MIQEPPQIPVYIVTGTNWTMEVPLDEFNMEFGNEEQILEAATRAVEFLKRESFKSPENIDHGCKLIMNADSRNENPFLGTVVNVHLKDSNPDNSVAIFTHICMGNTGLYKDADKMEKEFNKQVEVLKKRKAQQEQNEAQAKEFDKLKEEFAPKAKKPKK